MQRTRRQRCRAFIDAVGADYATMPPPLFELIFSACHGCLMSDAAPRARAASAAAVIAAIMLDTLMPRAPCRHADVNRYAADVTPRTCHFSPLFAMLIFYYVTTLLLTLFTMF